MDPFPDLPVDICRRVLETLALSDDKTSCLALVLVSKTVQKWINPILFHTLSVDNRMTSAQLGSLSELLRRGPAPLARHVRTLSLPRADFRVSNDPDILSSCTSLKKLGLWVEESFAEALLVSIRSPQVTHLAVLDHNFPHLRVMPKSITHLCLSFHDDEGVLHDVSGWASLFASHPAITHVMFCTPKNDVAALDEWLFDEWGVCSLVSLIAAVAPKTLKAMICAPVPGISGMKDPEGLMGQTIQRMHDEITDERFVLVCAEPTYRHVDGIACYEELHICYWEWGRLLPEDELDVWEMADHYLSIRASKRSGSSRD